MTSSESIVAALCAQTGGGSFRQLIELEGVGTRNHRFSFATGMASSFWEWKYRAAFQRSIPEWVSLEHPYVRSQLIQIAIRENSILPNVQPNDRHCYWDSEGEQR